MKKVILFLFLSVIFTRSIASCVIFCKACYQYQVYHPAVPPSYFEGPMGTLQIVGTGADAYYEKVWSNVYNLNIRFYSGYELNESSGSILFNPISIIAIVDWANGGHSVITISNWITNLKYITKNEVLFDNSTGAKIQKIVGYDKEFNYWEIAPQE
ncbi:MAG: hypothetical protein RB294_06270 [Bacteroidales bacterium]|jgi:hypothetical protein|nr:hypothetical protein [Bacteroidales bacterium]